MYKHLCVGFFMDISFQLLWGQISVSYGKKMFSFVRNHQTLFQSGWNFAFPLAINEFLLLHLLTSIWCCQYSPFWPFWYVFIDISLFKFAISQWLLTWASFHMLICHLYIFSDELSVQVFQFSPVAQLYVHVFSTFLKLGCLFSLVEY